MSWLAAVGRVFAARWFPIALICIPAFVTIVFGWGYLTGSHDTELDMAEKMNKALALQAEELRQAHSRQIAALEAKTRREREASKIDDIPRPAGELCDAGGEWLHAIQDGIRMSNSAAGAH